MQKRRQFSRAMGEIAYRRICIISTEGCTTERIYFELFNTAHSVVSIRFIKKENKSSPKKVLSAMKTYLSKNPLRNNDIAWLVIDKDAWPDEQILELFNWSLQNAQYGLALSNPRFEYWLLLHFDDGNNIKSIQDCETRLKKALPSYNNKSFDSRKITKEAIENAINRAEKRDNPPCDKWPLTTGTTVYRLVKLLNK